MNNGLKYGLFFLGGLALGVVGTVAVTRGKLDLKPLATDRVSRGMDMKDAIMSKVEAVKEDMEDLAAEARLEAVEAVHRMRRIRVGRDTEEVVLTATRAPGGLHGAPLERIGGHQVPAFASPSVA